MIRKYSNFRQQTCEDLCHKIILLKTGQKEADKITKLIMVEDAIDRFPNDNLQLSAMLSLIITKLLYCLSCASVLLTGKEQNILHMYNSSTLHALLF